MHLLIVLLVTAGPGGAAAAPLPHSTAALDTTALASEQGAGQTERVTKVTAERGGPGPGPGPELRWHGKVTSAEALNGWRRRREGWKECIRRADGALEAAPSLLSPC